ncbi:MAG: ISAzo13 family transposase [Candidatus Entotheonellia bacterium]
MISSTQEQAIKAKYEALKSELDERARRLWAATEARSLGHGGIATVTRATGLAASTVRLGKQELTSPSQVPPSPRRLRRQGAGRKSLTTQDQTLLKALDALVEPTTRGDPMSPLRWTCKSTRRLAKELCQQGHHVSHSKVGQLLKSLNYSLQGTRKTREGASHPDRNAQFEYINTQVKDFQQRGQPVISVDTKKKELVGDFANGGREYQPQGVPERVRVHDFVDKRLGKAIPYGVYDMTHNCGWVSVGVDHDTAAFAVATVQQWWQRMGQQLYPQAQHVLITADGGGSNGSRSRLWKVALQRFSDATGLAVSVCHFPPGTSKWNKIEHRLFCHITENWRGRPLVSQEVIVNLLANTTTAAGLRVEAALDPTPYETGTKVSAAELAQVNLSPAHFHGNDWNYMIKPRDKNQ